MKTPICDFVRRYAECNPVRLHMPGHKGKSILGFESFDITEIDGADSLYEANGIIHESEANASVLFGADTFYSTEGSSLCIRAMLYLIALYAKQYGKRPLIAAGRNAHKTFLSAAALLDFDITWLWPEQSDSYLCCRLTADQVNAILSEAAEKPVAVYITSPDYLGNLTELKAIAKVCHRHNVLLAVDNAHGAYLHFLQRPCHPIDLGADICCDSAHKTLPVLTGGAYLHISPEAPAFFFKQAKNAMALFGSTSPSYLILQSLDAANAYLAHGYRDGLHTAVSRIQKLKTTLSEGGYCLIGEEPLKITIDTKPYGYEGRQFADILAAQNMICEFSDPDYVVMMFTPETDDEDFSRLESVMLSVPQRTPVTTHPPMLSIPEQVMSARAASMSPWEEVPVSESIGKILALSSVSCPPAIPIVVSGECIDEDAARCFDYYGIKTCIVVK